MQSFPVKSPTACPLKWEWSTLFLYMGTTNSCHRTSLSQLAPGETGNFHNTAAKLAQRNTMLNGEWPARGNGCEYCRDIEDAGGMSDRTTALKLCGTDAEQQKLIPVELLRDPDSLAITPTILEVYFTNRCNMSCIYCGPDFSTQWLNENKKHGVLEHHATRLSWERATALDEEYAGRLAEFWKWLEANYRSLKMFHILGGEPFYQTETLESIRFWFDHPNPDLHLKIVSNLKVPPAKFKQILQELRTLHTGKKCSSVGIIASLDCWGREAEYIRTGLELDNWQKNFEYLIFEHPWAEVSINATMNALSIRTMPDLIERVNAWNERRDRIIGESPGTPKVTLVFNLLQGPEFLHAGIFREGFFDEEFQRILRALPARNPWEIAIKEYMAGLWKVIEAKQHNPVLIGKLKDYLTEIDRRRNTNWKEVFPWLDRES